MIYAPRMMNDVFAVGKHEGKKEEETRVSSSFNLYNAFCLAKSFLNFALCTLHFALKTMFAPTICLPPQGGKVAQSSQIVRSRVF